MRISKDTALFLVVLFLASVLFNVYQRFQYQDLLKEHVDVQWQAQNMEINWQYVKMKYERCLRRFPDCEPSASTEPQIPDVR